MAEDAGKMGAAAVGESAVRQGLSGVSDAVAQFAEEKPSALKRVQHFLHKHPTAIRALCSSSAFSFSR